MRYLFILVLSFFSNNIFALDYYWAERNTAVEHYNTPLDYCNFRQSIQSTTYPHMVPFSIVLTKNSPDQYVCFIKRQDGNNQEATFINRYGTTCPTNTTYNSETGLCESPPVVCKAGELFPAKGADGTVVTSNGVNYVSGSYAPTVCYQQCTYSPPDGDGALSVANRSVSCYGTPGGVGWCNYILKGTGANCSADNYSFSKSGPQLNPSDTANVPESDPLNPLCPKGWSVSNGVCFKNPVDPLNPPPETGTASNETGGTGTGGGGSGSTAESAGATDDLADSVAGTSVDTASAPCVPNADGSGCVGNTVRGEQCDVVLACTGDAIQCASLRYQKAQRCASIYDVPAQNFVKTQISKDEYQLTENEVDGSDLFADGTGAARWLPSACPSPKAINLHGISTTLSMQPACDFASALGPLFVALASIFFAVYVGRAFGGS